jgi:hypothetical protein
MIKTMPTSPSAMQLSPVLIALAGGLLASPLAHAACNIVDGKAYGDCGSMTIRSGAKPALEVHGYIAESAIISGATIHPGGFLHLSGILNGDIAVRRGGQLTVTGMANGVVRSDGGAVTVEGIVQRLESNGGTTTVGGNVHSVGGSGSIYFKSGSVLAGVPIDKAKRWP